MVTKIKLLSILFHLSFCLSAQTLTGDYQGYLYKNYYIGKYEKGKYVLIDSISLDNNGTFSKVLTPALYSKNTQYIVASEGEYKENKRISNPHPHGSIRFIYTGENVSYLTSWRQETGYLSFIKGGEPSMQINDLSIRLDSLQFILNQIEQLLLSLKESDPFYKQAFIAYIEKASAFNNYCKNVANQYTKKSYLNVYALMFQQVVPQKGMNYEDFQVFRAKNLFQFTDLKNPLVANVPILPNMYRSYLYHNQPSGIVESDLIQKMQDSAKSYIQKNACIEVLEVLNIQDFRPHVQILRERLINEINFDTLYLHDEAWYTELNEVLGAYDKKAPYHTLFGIDIITALERTQKPEAYTKLAEAAFSIMEQFNWGEAQMELVEYLTEKSDHRLLKGSGKIALIYSMKSVKVGLKAPNIVLPDKKVIKSSELSDGNNEQTLLVFFASDCGHCEEMISQLKARYQLLQVRKIRVIAISADTDEALFNKTKSGFLWKDTYCDLMGMNGVNFKSYAVQGTPTLILLDKNGVILKRSALFSEIIKEQ